MKASILILMLMLAAAALAQNRWGEDSLIDHMANGLTQVGPGYSHFDCLYGENSDLFVGYIESATSEGDVFFLRKSASNGLTWSFLKKIESGPNLLFSPAVSLLPGNQSLLAACITEFPVGTRFIDTYRFSYNDLTYQGYSQGDFSYPGAGDPVFCFTICNITGGEVWLFVLDDNNWLFLTRTADGITWTPSQPVAANVIRPSAETSADGHVALTWLHAASGEIMCAISDADGNFQPAVTVAGNPSPSASPVVCWEDIGAENLGIVWHSQAGESCINLSFDNGSTWGSDLVLGNGIFPSMDHFPGTRRTGACFTTTDGQVKVAGASTIAGLPGASFTTRSSHEAYSEGPARVAFGELSEQLALFYLSPATDDFWFNSSLVMGIEDEDEAATVSVTACPNPCRGSFTVTAAGFPGAVEYFVFAVDGRVMVQTQNSSGGFTVNPETLPAGVYTVVAEDGTSRASCRLVRF